MDLSVGANKADTNTTCDCWTNSSLAETVEAAKVCKFPTETKGGIQSRKQGGLDYVLDILTFKTIIKNSEPHTSLIGFKVYHNRKYNNISSRFSILYLP